MQDANYSAQNACKVSLLLEKLHSRYHPYYKGLQNRVVAADIIIAILWPLLREAGCHDLSFVPYVALQAVPITIELKGTFRPIYFSAAELV